MSILNIQGFNSIQVILSLILVVGVFSLAFAFWLIFLRREKTPEWALKLQKRYRIIKNKTLEEKYILLELDKIVENYFKDRYKTNSALGNSLKKYQKNISKDNLDILWFAHKQRNKIVHQADYNASSKDLKKSIIGLKRFIEDKLNRYNLN